MALALTGCGAVQSATKAGMKPILHNGVEGFVSEPDPVVAEGALVANMKLIEGVVATYPDDVELLEMAAMARANYAFGFLQDELEALVYARPNDRSAARAMVARIQLSYGSARRYAERALLDNDAWVRALAGRELETLNKQDFTGALSTLEPENAAPLFWLAFAWGGSLQVKLDPAEATQLPKIEAAIERVRELDEHVFYDIGVDLMAGVAAGFRSPALGGNPKAAEQYFASAKQKSGLLFPDVLLAQFVYAQTEQQEAFEQILRRVLATPGRPDRALLEVLAKRKACRLLAHMDDLFLTASNAVPEECELITHKYPLQAAP